MKHYEAPWSTSLIVMSVLTTVICVGVTAGSWLGLVGKHTPGVLGYVALLPLVILFGAALFTIRGYSISSDSILVHRLLWSTVLPRTGLESAEVDLEAMRGSLRTFGNGGAFSFTGFYYNKRLGSYRAYVTDPHRAVVLSYAKRRVVLSPAMPEDFVDDLAAAKPQPPSRAEL
jgi:Bacterial PH domain